MDSSPGASRLPSPLVRDLRQVLAQSPLPAARIRRDVQAAEDTLQKALELEPDNLLLLQTHVQLLMEKGCYELAEHVLARAMAIDPDQMQHTRTMFLLRAYGSREGLEAAEELLREYPDDAAAHYLRGISLLNRARPSEAVRHLREAAALRPAEPLFAASARLFNAWYLWPAHATGGAMHYILTTVFFVMAIVAMGISEDLSALWKTLLPWFGFVAYKWIVMGVTMLRLRLHVG